MATKKKLSPQEEIRSYSLKEGDYSITVKILEANDLIPKNKGFFGLGAAQLCTSQVLVQVLDKKRKSKVIKNQANPVYNQGWTFYLKALKLEQLQDMTIKITLYDRSSLISTYIIGQYELDLTSVYFQLNHEYFHTWLTLTDPTDEVEGPTGYLYCNMSVLGPGDEPVVHDIGNAKKAGSGKEKSLVPQKINQIGHQIEINIYRAENLPCLDNNLEAIDAYVVAKFGGVMAQTRVVKSRNPEWNQCIKLQCMLPSQSKQITLSVYDKDLASEDDLVGQIKINLVEIQYKKHQPKWGNLYGAPVTAEGQNADLQNFYGTTLGSHYRGRLLFSCSSYNKKEPRTVVKTLQFSFPHNPIPQTKMRSYILWVDILEGNEIPDKSNDMIVHISMGPYMLATKPRDNINGQVNWFESLEERKVIFPEDIEQVPDLIVYLTDANREDRRMSYNRIKASKILRTQSDFNQDIHHETILAELREDRSLDLVKDDEFPGFVILKASLLKFRPQQERILESQEKQYQLLADLTEYQLRLQLYQARDLPPADETGGCDPFIKVKCAGKIGTSKVKQRTLNPGWYESINVDKVALPSIESLMKTKYPTKGMFLTVYDCDENKLLKNDQSVMFIKQLQDFDIKKKISNLYSRIMKKGGDNNDEIDDIQDGGHDDSKALLIKSSNQSKTPGQTPEDGGENIELNDSGIAVNDPDKIDKDLLGRIWIPLEASHVKFRVYYDQTEENTKQEVSKLEVTNQEVKKQEETKKGHDLYSILYRRPKWYPIKYDATGEYTGQVLLSYTLIPNAYAEAIKTKKTLYPKYEEKRISFFLIGVREIDQEALGKKLNKISASLDISGDSQKQFKTEEMKVVNSGGNINQYVEFVVKVPLNKSFDPVVDIFLWDCSRSEPYTFLGYGSLPFKDIPYLKYSKHQDENADIESEMSLLECLRQAIYLEKKMATQTDIKVLETTEKIEKKDRKVYQRNDDQNGNLKNNKEDKLKNENDMPQNQQDIPKTDLNMQKNESGMLKKDRVKDGLDIAGKKELNSINLQDQYLYKKDNIEETDDIEDEERIQNVQDGSDQQQKVYEEADIQIVDIKEKTFDQNDINVSPAYDNNQEQEKLISNLPEMPLNLQSMKQNKIIDVRDPESIRQNDFITKPVNQTLNTDLSLREGANMIGTQNKKGYQPLQDQQSPKFVSQQTPRSPHDQDKRADFMNASQHTHVEGQGQELVEQGSIKPKSKLAKKKSKKAQSSQMSTFNPTASLTFSVKSHSKKSLDFDDIPKEGIVLEQEVEETKKKKSSKILNVFKKKDGIKILEYEDFDTDEDEDLDITPEWKKNREIFLSEFEDIHKPSRKLTCIPIMRGQSRGNKKDLFSFDRPEDPSQFAMLKMLFMDSNNPNFLKKTEELKKLLKERSYVTRVYITRGKNIGGEGSSPDSYLKLKMGDQLVDLKKKTLREDTNNPDYYISHDFDCKLPGSAVLEVQVWDDTLGSDDMIGKTVIDMENRLFTGKWLKYDKKKPFENRNVFPEDESTSKGNLEMWVELIPKSVIKLNPPLVVTKPPTYEMEIRVIVWETKDCVFKDEIEKCNDIYVRMGLQNKPDDHQETDVHWRCRSSGFFNWRMKFRQTYPLNNDEYGGDKLFVQLLDKDLVAQDDIIGSCVIDLNQHKLIDKCLKRQKPVSIQMRELNRKAKISDKIWYQVFNPLIRDDANKPIIQGQVCLSIEVMPVKEAEEKKNGLGRDAPNNYPPLDEPPGRMKFDIMHPFEFLKTIIGPSLYRKCCGVFLFLLIGAFCFGFGFILVTQIIAAEIVN